MSENVNAILKLMAVDEDSVDEFTKRLAVYLVISGKKYYQIWSYGELEEDLNGYTANLDRAINELFLIKNATKLPFNIDESVYLHIDGQEEEVKQYVNSLCRSY